MSWSNQSPAFNRGEKMKRFTIIFSVALLVGAVFFVGQALASSHGKKMKEANTIDELVEMFDDKACAECHEDQYEQWEKSYHSKAINSSLGGIHNFIKVGLEKEWKTKVNKAQLMKCLDCHAPVVAYASEKLAVEIGNMIVTAHAKKGTPESDAAKKQLAKLNVGCIACHNIKAAATAKNLRGKPVPGAVYAVNDADTEDHETIQSAEMKRSVFCMQCHGVYTAPDGETVQCNTLSGSYMHDYNVKGGTQTCQDCHMKVKDRGHTFPGGHNLDIVKDGLGLDVNIAAYRHLPGKIPGVKNKKAWVPSALVTATVENKAGHRIPDG